MQYAYYHLIQTCNCWDCGCFGCFLQLLMSRIPVLKLGFWLFFLRILTIYRMEPSVVSHKKDSYLSRVEHQLFWGQGPSIEFSSLYRFRRQIQYQPTIFADVFGIYIYMSLFFKKFTLQHCSDFILAIPMYCRSWRWCCAVLQNNTHFSSRSLCGGVPIAALTRSM